MSEDLKVWLVLCGLALLTVTLIASAVAIHNPHYDARSVAFAIVLTLGIEFAITAIVNLISWLGDIL